MTSKTLTPGDLKKLPDCPFELRVITPRQECKISDEVKNAILDMKSKIEKQTGIQYEHPAIVVPDASLFLWPERLEIGGFIFPVLRCSDFPDSIMALSSNRDEIFIVGLRPDDDL